ncbi:DUF1839 family protein [Bosea sp. Root483D1]|uniref:DUF1839 family protein n=1 Tax=Bosea sp. Root483D1 TaxID=1736544 RepID=UPI000A5548BB|nr:DUF1839 family protein [Bosea sp. Root483D1]
MTAQRKIAARAVMAGRLLPVDPLAYDRHAMHAGERHWPQTNCYADLWIEILHALRLEPAAAFGFTITQDFEGDQFTFFKPPLDDLEALYGLKVTELALYDDLIGHIEQQIGLGRLVLLELDSFYMPDTRGVSYRDSHGKTTIAVNRLDRVARELDYFHNDGLHRAEGEDFDGLFRLLPGQMRDDTLFPYAEMVRLPQRRPDKAALRATALKLLARHVARRPQDNPVAAFRIVATAQAEALAERPGTAFHHYAFNTLRQLGANFELLASHLSWLGQTVEGLDLARDGALRIAEGAKVAQFHLARAMKQKRFERLDATLAGLVGEYAKLSEALGQRFPG